MGNPGIRRREGLSPVRPGEAGPAKGGTRWSTPRTTGRSRGAGAAAPVAHGAGHRAAARRRAGGLAKLVDAAGRTVVLVRPHQLDRDGARAVGQLDLGEDEGEPGPGLPDRDVADLAALGGVPAEPGAVAGPDGVFHVRVGPGLVELVVERRRHVLPGLVEDGDAVPVLGVHADGVVDGGARDVRRSVVPAQAVPGIGGFGADRDHGPQPALVLGLGARRRLEAGREAVHQDHPAGQHDVDERAARVGVAEGAAAVDPGRERFHLVLVDGGRDAARAAPPTAACAS